MNLLKFKQTEHSYLKLGDNYYQRNNPTPVKAPSLFLWNKALAEELGIKANTDVNQQRFAEIFSGNELAEGSEPLSMAYAGHQFGQFNPQLGDGRAHLLGELIDQSDCLKDVQLKGSGRSAFSRGGDGRCALGPAVREFIMSEAMYALGIPTTRCLAVVKTGETVFRDEPLPGAVVTRVAASHLRVGTFEFYSARQDLASVRQLADYAIARHYSAIDEEGLQGRDRYIALVDQAMQKQIELVTEWMRVGFIHGVMNTDNTAISGETIDYGPCAMMSAYDPKTVFSSIDMQGRYAFGNQPAIAQWNMARFAECLLPLVDEDDEKAVETIGPVISSFPERFEQSYMKMLAGKLGIQDYSPSDKPLLMDLLELLNARTLDYTNTFDRLTYSLSSASLQKTLSDELGDWYQAWQQRVASQALKPDEIQAAMRSHNPLVIPRNHHIENVLAQCISSEDAGAAEDILTVLRHPYELKENTHRYQDSPADNDQGYQTFCGT